MVRRIVGWLSLVRQPIPIGVFPKVILWNKHLVFVLLFPHTTLKVPEILQVASVSFVH